MLSSVTAAARAPSAGRTNEPGCLNECVRLPSANFTHPSHASRRRPAFPRCSIARSASERLSTISRTERDRLARSEGRREVSLTSAGEGGRKERAEKSEPRRASRKERGENYAVIRKSGARSAPVYSESVTVFSARPSRLALLPRR